MKGWRLAQGYAKTLGSIPRTGHKHKIELCTANYHVLLTLDPEDITLASERTPFPLPGHSLTPDTFSQCSWQQGVVGQLVLPDLSNFNNTKNVLDGEFDGYF